MKYLLLLVLFSISHLIHSQDSSVVTIASIRTQQFYDSITRMIENFETDSIDFIAIRSNVTHGTNCRFIVKRDSCSYSYILVMREEKLIDYIHCRHIESRNPVGQNKPSPCFDILEISYNSLTHWEDYFSEIKPDFSAYDSSKIIITGHVHGRYISEIVDRDYFSVHHSGMFYATFRNYF